MELKVYKSLWGMTGTLEEQFEQIKRAGYDGIECTVQDLAEPYHFRSLLEAYGFELVALIYTEGSDHTEEFKRRVGNAMFYSPRKVVAHAARDTMSFIKQIRFLVTALRTEENAGVPIAHETHRRRPFYSPMNTVAILRELPELKLNVDFSHWCCVTESLLEDHEEAIELASEHAIHIHGRVGFENGPQVPDPRVQEWERCVLRHERWWDRVIAWHENLEAAELTFVPEFGPPTYMPTVPATGEPTANLWDVCLWSADRFRKQFAARLAQPAGLPATGPALVQ